jgi:hypothetical protein
LHADIPLDGSGSGFLGLLLIMLGQTIGVPGSGGRCGQARGGSAWPLPPVQR